MIAKNENAPAPLPTQPKVTALSLTQVHSFECRRPGSGAHGLEFFICFSMIFIVFHFFSISIIQLFSIFSYLFPVCTVPWLQFRTGKLQNIRLFPQTGEGRKKRIAKQNACPPPQKNGQCSPLQGPPQLMPHCNANLKGFTHTWNVLHSMIVNVSQFWESIFFNVCLGCSMFFYESQCFSIYWKTLKIIEWPEEGSSEEAPWMHIWI